MRALTRALITTAITSAALVAVACVSDSGGGCPRPGLDLPRRCKRLCVLSPGKNDAPLPCACIDQCLCWQMAGHSRRPDPPEAGPEPPR